MKATIQQGPGLTSSATNHPSRVTSSANHKHWIGLQCLDGKRLLEQIDLPGSTEEKMNALRHWRDDKTGPYHRFWQYALCKRYYIGIGCLQVTACVLSFRVASIKADRVMQPTPGSESMPHEIQFEALVRNGVLTKGFRRPGSLADETWCFERLLSCKIANVRTPMQHEHVVFIGVESDRARLACCFVVWAVLALVIGTAVAFATHKIGTGAAVGGGLLGFVAFVQAACVFAHG
jgi:hypothetical protein